MTVPVLTRAELSRATLARQLLLERSDCSPVAAIERLFGMQAQVPRPPFVGLWTRLEGFRREALLETIRERRVVRGTMMRGTLHLVSTEDYLRFRPVLQAVLDGFMSYAKDSLPGIQTEDTLVAARLLLEERPRAFDEIRTALVARGLPGNERAMGLMVRMLIPLLQVPSDTRWGFDAKAPFALAERWLERPLSAGAGVEALVKRYLAAFGPATVSDAQAWSGMKGLKPVFERLRGELVVFRDEARRELFDLPDSPRPPGDTPAPVRFLPDFDNLVLAHDDRSRVMDREHRGRIVSKNLLVAATFLVDGYVAGIWKCEVKRKAAALLLQPFAPLKRKDQAALEKEGMRLLRFLEEDATEYSVVVEG
jgi:hypothetical protein